MKGSKQDIQIDQPITYSLASGTFNKKFKIYNRSNSIYVFRIKTNQKSTISMQFTHDFVLANSSKEIILKLVQEPSETTPLKLQLNYAIPSEQEIKLNNSKMDFYTRDNVFKKIVNVVRQDQATFSTYSEKTKPSPLQFEEKNIQFVSVLMKQTEFKNSIRQKIKAKNRDLVNIFDQIDKDKDGLISKYDLQATSYAFMLFENNYYVLRAFDTLDQKMCVDHFVLLAKSYQYNLHEFMCGMLKLPKLIEDKIKLIDQSKIDKKIKQTFFKLSAYHNRRPNEKTQRLRFQLKNDEAKQQKKINQLSQIFGHPIHEIFFLLKFKTKNAGSKVGEYLKMWFSELLEFISSKEPKFEQLANSFESHVAFKNGYTYFIVEVDNEFFDNLAKFFYQLLQSISPEYQLKFAAQLEFYANNILGNQFSFKKVGGHIKAELDIDTVSLSVAKKTFLNTEDAQININQEKNLLFMFLLQELQLQAEFDYLGQALQLLFGQILTPKQIFSGINKQGLMENLNLVSSKSEALLNELKNNCLPQGEISLNIHDLQIKLQFDLFAEKFFDLLK